MHGETSVGLHNSSSQLIDIFLFHDSLFYMADSNLMKKAAVATSPELTDKVIFYFVDHGMQILTLTHWSEDQLQRLQHAGLNPTVEPLALEDIFLELHA